MFVDYLPDELKYSCNAEGAITFYVGKFINVNDSSPLCMTRLHSSISANFRISSTSNDFALPAGIFLDTENGSFRGTPTKESDLITAIISATFVSNIREENYVTLESSVLLSVRIIILCQFLQFLSFSIFAIS